jgi:hypothetical protein
MEDCLSYDRDYTIIGDVVIEIDTESGEVLNDWTTFDILDPCRRINRGFQATREGFADWTHANSVVLDIERNAVLVSLRSSDWVIAIRYADDEEGDSGDLLWRLGAEGDFELRGDGALWQDHQHAAQVLPAGNLLMYDNGNFRPGTSPDDLQSYPWSRVVEYEIDTSDSERSNWTATEVWEYGSEDILYTDEREAPPIDVRYYSGAFGDADLTDANTVLITHGRISIEGVAWARVFEVTHDAEKRIVFDLRVADPEGRVPQQIYAADRIPTLYTTPELRGEVAPR